MDANLNNPAAALITANQPSSSNASGAMPGLPGNRNDGSVGSQAAPAGESDFSNKIRSLQQDSVKESRAAQASGSGTEAPRDEASTSSTAASAESPATAETAGEEPLNSNGAELSATDADGKPLPVTGKELPVSELVAEAEADAPPARPGTDAIDDATVPTELRPATTEPESLTTPAEEADQSELPRTAVDAEPIVVPVEQERAAQEAALIQARPDQALAGTAGQTPISPAGIDRSASAPPPPPTSTAAPIGSAAAATGARSDGADMNFDGGANAHNGTNGTGDSQAGNGSNVPRASFSTELPALVATPGTSPASSASAAATLAELDTLAASRPLQAQAGQEQFARGLGERMLLMADGGLQSARIKISPENLGPLDIRIQVQDDATQVWFNASQGQTREILEQAMPRLRELLADQGMRLTDANVTGGDNGGSGETRDDGQAPEPDWRQPPPPTLEERIAGRSLHQLIEARRLLDVYA